MSTSKQRDGARERFWRRMVRQWRKSGLSVRAFCGEQDLAEASFYAWRRTLQRRDAVAFLPVQVVTEQPVAPTPTGSHAGLELVLDTGWVLRIAPGFDAPTLQRLLALLEEGRPC